MSFAKLKKAIMALTTVSFVATAHAQQAQTGEHGVLSPPPGVSNIVSVDAHNNVLVETQNPNEPKQYSLAVPQHIYSGGVARVLGGTIIPTEALVIPQSAMRSNMGAPGNFGTFPGFGGPNNGNNFGRNFGNTGNNFGNSQFGNFNGFNRGFPTFAPRVPVNNLNQFNQVFGYLDKPIPQAQVGVGFSDATSVNNSGYGIGFGQR